MDWSSVILDPAFLAGLDRMAAKRFVQPALAEEAAGAMLDALSETDWQRLRAFGGKSAPATYAYAVAGRAMEDFARRRFGRPRPPQWLQEKGQAWVRLWRMLCLERQWPETLMQVLGKEFVDGLVREAIAVIKQRIPRCGEPGFSECCVTELGLEQLPDDAGDSVDQALARTQHQHALAVLGRLLNPADATVGSGPSDEEDVLNELIRRLALTADDRLLLSLSYEDGLSSRKIATLLETSAATVQRRLAGLHHQLEQALRVMGLADTTAAGEVNLES
ncbi:sigma-70 family RNA polymerase sigma factor [Alcanivorax profundi]|uniref:sigma-70 family RNA polymerase sigma factor n=1 Tax=Alcanivorax profundi TaxID=2338368 RepID=UPI0004B4ECBF